MDFVWLKWILKTCFSKRARCSTGIKRCYKNRVRCSTGIKKDAIKIEFVFKSILTVVFLYQEQLNHTSDRYGKNVVYGFYK